MNGIVLRSLFVVMLLIGLRSGLWAQRVSVAFYNVENLYDTIASPFGGDTDYTPKGARQWTAQKYREKINDLCRVIDSMNADVLGLCEVENETVVRDLVMNLRADYCYLHRTTSDRRGLDMALLYKADKFIPDRVWQIGGQSREPLAVQGELLGKQVTLVLCHQPSMYNSRRYRASALESLAKACDELRTEDNAVIAMGDFNFDTSEGAIRRMVARNRNLWRFFSEFDNPIGQAVGDRGSYAYDGRWSLLDNILIDKRLSGAVFDCTNSGVFVREYMINGHPSARRVRLLSAVSDHLPVFVVLSVVKKM